MRGQFSSGICWQSSRRICWQIAPRICCKAAPGFASKANFGFASKVRLAKPKKERRFPSSQPIWLRGCIGHHMRQPIEKNICCKSEIPLPSNSGRWLDCHRAPRLVGKSSTARPFCDQRSVNARSPHRFFGGEWSGLEGLHRSDALSRTSAANLGVGSCLQAEALSRGTSGGSLRLSARGCRVQPSRRGQPRRAAGGMALAPSHGGRLGLRSGSRRPADRTVAKGRDVTTRSTDLRAQRDASPHSRSKAAVRLAGKEAQVGAPGQRACTRVHGPVGTRSLSLLIKCRPGPRSIEPRTCRARCQPINRCVPVASRFLLSRIFPSVGGHTRRLRATSSSDSLLSQHGPWQVSRATQCAASTKPKTSLCIKIQTVASGP